MLIEVNSDLEQLINDTNCLIELINKYFDTEIKQVVKANVSDSIFNHNYRVQLINRYKKFIDDICKFVNVANGLHLNRTIDGIVLSCPSLIKPDGLSFESTQNYVIKQEKEINQTLKLAKQILIEQGLIDEEGNNDD